MVQNTIHATYTETYDLNTILNELNILGIHTPQAPALKFMFKGFFEQYKKFKILGCNFRLVCASQQSLDPTLIGTGDGQIAARDVLNPILFKACTGEHINALLDQVYNASQEQNVGTYGASVSQHLDSGTRALNAYYAMLADDSFRREHPQRGLTVMGLKPMVHRVVTTQPFKWEGAGDFGGPYIEPTTTSPDASDNVKGFGGISGSSTYSADPVNRTVFLSNGMTDLPWMDTAFSHVAAFTNGSGQDAGNAKAMNLVQKIPRVYMGVLVLPPSEQMQLFFRMQIVWHIAFKDFRPCMDLLPVSAPDAINTDDAGALGLVDGVNRTYFNLYHSASKLDKEFGSFDANGLEGVETVNEKVN